MPKIKDVLSQAKMAEGIAEEVKYRWLGQLDGKTYTFPEDADTELKMKSIKVYTTYLEAMDAFFSGDMASYEVLALKLRLAYEEEMRRV